LYCYLGYCLVAVHVEYFPTISWPLPCDQFLLNSLLLAAVFVEEVTSGGNADKTGKIKVSTAKCHHLQLFCKMNLAGDEALMACSGLPCTSPQDDGVGFRLSARRA
jgi:hypothetical protein